MSQETAILVTAWATIGTAVAAFVAVWISWCATRTTIQQAKTSTAYQVINQIDAQWNSDAMKAKRRDAAKFLSRGQALPEDDGIDDVIDVFEVLALAVRDGVVPLKLAVHFMGYWAVRYWYVATVRITRRRADDSSIWAEFAAVVPMFLTEFARMRQRSVEEITPSSDELRTFLQEELTV